MRCAYAVTFESETDQPITVRGAVEGSVTRTCLVRAAQEALDRLKQPGKRIKWSSVVVVLEKGRVKA